MSLTDEEEFGEVEELDRGFWEPSTYQKKKVLISFLLANIFVLM